MRVDLLLSAHLNDELLFPVSVLYSFLEKSFHLFAHMALWICHESILAEQAFC